MPPGAEGLTTYGVLGILVFVGIWAIYQATLYLFSRDEKKPGYATQMLEAHITNQRKQGEFLDALVVREAKQQELCQRHNDHLVQIAEKVTEHNEAANRGWTDVLRLKAAAREACQLARTVAANEWPQSVEYVRRHCEKIEQIIDQA